MFNKYFAVTCLLFLFLSCTRLDKIRYVDDVKKINFFNSLQYGEILLEACLAKNRNIQTLALVKIFEYRQSLINESERFIDREYKQLKKALKKKEKKNKSKILAEARLNYQSILQKIDRQLLLLKDLDLNQNVRKILVSGLTREPSDRAITILFASLNSSDFINSPVALLLNRLRNWEIEEKLSPAQREKIKTELQKVLPRLEGRDLFIAMDHFFYYPPSLEILELFNRLSPKNNYYLTKIYQSRVAEYKRYLEG